MRNRTAITLVEVVGSLTIIASILTTSAILMNQAFGTHRSTLAHLQKMRSLEQFVDRWRTDVQTCQSLVLGDELRITLDEARQVRYAVLDNTVSRIVEIDSQESGSEVWTLPNTCSLTWQVDDSGQQRLLLGALAFSEAVGSKSIQMEPVELIARIGVAKPPPQATAPTQEQPDE